MRKILFISRSHPVKTQSFVIDLAHLTRLEEWMFVTKTQSKGTHLYSHPQKRTSTPLQRHWGHPHLFSGHHESQHLHDGHHRQVHRHPHPHDQHFLHRTVVLNN